MLARAFADDPTSAWLFPSVEGRARALEEWYRINSQILLATGEGWGTEKLESAALWLPVGLPLAPGTPHNLGRLLLWNLLTVWKLGSRVRQAAITTARLHRLHPWPGLVSRDPRHRAQVTRNRPGIGGAEAGPRAL